MRDKTNAINLVVTVGYGETRVPQTNAPLSILERHPNRLVGKPALSLTTPYSAVKSLASDAVHGPLYEGENEQSRRTFEAGRSEHLGVLRRENKTRQAMFWLQSFVGPSPATLSGHGMAMDASAVILDGYQGFWTGHEAIYAEALDRSQLPSWFMECGGFSCMPLYKTEPCAMGEKLPWLFLSSAYYTPSSRTCG